MKKYKPGPVISFENLRVGYKSTLANAIRFFGAAQQLMTEYPDKALALAQLGQEELGKSLTILAAFTLPLTEERWAWFWSGWRDHQLKGHRAYLYELVCPVRLEHTGKDGTVYSGSPLRPRLSEEKESGFYVDYNRSAKCFESPIDQASLVEAASRVMTLAYLSVTADAVRRTIEQADEDFRLKVFGQLAYRICSEELFQEDMPNIFTSARGQSARHESLFADLDIALSGNVAFLNTLGQTATRDTR